MQRSSAHSADTKASENKKPADYGGQRIDIERLHAPQPGRRVLDDIVVAAQDTADHMQVGPLPAGARRAHQQGRARARWIDDLATRNLALLETAQAKCVEPAAELEILKYRPPLRQQVENERRRSWRRCCAG